VLSGPRSGNRDYLLVSEIDLPYASSPYAPLSAALLKALDEATRRTVPVILPWCQPTPILQKPTLLGSSSFAGTLPEGLFRFGPLTGRECSILRQLLPTISPASSFSLRKIRLHQYDKDRYRWLPDLHSRPCHPTVPSYVRKIGDHRLGF
jgi:hypothetical protein